MLACGPWPWSHYFRTFIIIAVSPKTALLSLVRVSVIFYIDGMCITEPNFYLDCVWSIMISSFGPLWFQKCWKMYFVTLLRCWWRLDHITWPWVRPQSSQDYEETDEYFRKVIVLVTTWRAYAEWPQIKTNRLTEVLFYDFQLFNFCGESLAIFYIINICNREVHLVDLLLTSNWSWIRVR